MIYLTLFWEFLKAGLFAFGGAYGAVPLFRDAAVSNGWMTEEMFANVVAISESTPGPIMLNMATYVGNVQGGLLGAVAATLGVALPSFVIILLVTAFLRAWLKNRRVQNVLRGIRPCVMGVILATGAYMAVTAVFPGSGGADITAAVIALVAAAAPVAYKKLAGSEMSPIAVIVLAAVLGVALY